MNKSSLSLSPTVQSHLQENYDINYPPQFLHHPNRRVCNKELIIGEDGFFRAAVNVHDFKTEQIKLKIVAHYIIIQASHEEKEDEHGFIMRNFTKKYILPLDVDVDKLISWTSRGVLYIKAPSLAKDLEARIVNIKLVDDK